MKNLCLSLLSLCTLVAAPAFCRADQSDDEAAIRRSDDAYVAAYNAHDAKAVAELWSPEAVYVDPDTGEEAVGRDAIQKEFEATFKDAADSKLELDVKAIKFLSPNVAIENGIARIIRPKDEPDESTYTALFVKHEGKWFLDRVKEDETAADAGPPTSNFEYLKELDWMIGSWVDNDDVDHTMVQTDCNWTKNKNFMTRSFAMSIDGQVNMAGMQVVGWDPIAKQIRSWVFDSDGGFSEGKWRRKGDRWLIQQTGTLPDGSKSTAVNIIKEIDKDSFTWQSVDRSLNGDLLPAVDEVLIVRKPAE